MKKGTAIKEDNKARQFAAVQKVVINKTSSGTSLWVPEDIAETDELSVTENGVYCAYDDNVFGYSQVVVNVSESLNDRSEKDKAISKITGTNPDTGDTESYGVDEDGNLTKEVIPSGLPQSIHIVIAPTKKTYNEGDSLDFTGIHVYLLDGEGHQWTSDEYPTGEIPFEELIFPETIAHSEGPGYNTSTLGGESAYYTNLATWRYKWSDGKPHSLTASSSGYLVGLSQVLYCFSSQQGVAGASTVSLDGGEPSTFGTETSGTYTINGETKTYYWARCSSTYYLPETTSGLDYWEVSMPVTALSDADRDKYAKIVLEGTHSGGGGTSSTDVPVQWVRSDGQTLEDIYQITVTASSQPISGGSSSGGEHTGGDF